MCSDYFKVSGIAAPRRWKACRWVLVGSVSIGMVTWVPVVPDLVAGQGGQVLEQASEAVVGLPGGVEWYDALAWAAAERRAGVTGLPGTGGFWSVKVSGARARRRCQVR